MSWWRKKEYPEFYKQYLQAYDADESRIISLDIETDTHQSKKAKIISFGSVDIVEDLVPFSSIVEMHFSTPSGDNENIKIHELINRSDLPSVEAKLPDILSSIGSKIILGHFIEFDIEVINQALKSVGAGPLKNNSLDTLQLALKRDGVRDLSRVKREDYSLYALCERFGIVVSDGHQALTDAYLSALLYLHLK